MLQDTFCSSPWFHIRIDPQGNFVPCRWAAGRTTLPYNISNTTILEFVNSDRMRQLRMSMLNGGKDLICSSCYYEDINGKVSGRQRQLNKSGINVINFEKTFCASPHFDSFRQTFDQLGATDFTPVDLQIDLGNTCNSGCIMCIPTYSSRLAADYEKLNTLDPLLFKQFPKYTNWTDDPTLVDKFVGELAQLPNIKYIHFLGGETLYLPSFYSICERLIELGLAKNISLGITTNCTVHTTKLENIIREFKHVHLGLSVETFTPLNDYVRWPSKIDAVKENIHKFLDLREATDMHLSLRITPNIFTVYHLSTVFEFMLDNHITAESCNILHEPSCLRIELLPAEIIEKVIADIDSVIEKYNLSSPDTTIINRRREDLIDAVNTEIIFEYRRFFANYLPPGDVDEQRTELVKFIKAFESIRHNSILDYLPEYEEFLRSYGY